MSKVEQLELKLKVYTEKVHKQIKKLQSKCKHKKTKRWSDYGGINEQCQDCGFWLR